MINLPEEVKSGDTILCIGTNTKVGEYAYGKGYVYCRSYENMEPLPEAVDIIVFMHEPSSEIRAKIEPLASSSENPRIYEAWKE